MPHDQEPQAGSSPSPEPEPAKEPTPEPGEELFQALLERYNGGDVQAREELFLAVASELHELARREMRKQPPGHTLQATAVMNEAYVRLFGRRPAGYADKAHLLRAAARAMGHVLKDHARAKMRLKRCGAGVRVELDAGIGCQSVEQASSFLEFSEELERLGRAHPDMARAIEMRLYFGLTMDEIAQALGIPLRTLEREYAAAAALLAARLR
jgi:RNA polymerase sigma factor (TIGR02999 family)